MEEEEGSSCAAELGETWEAVVEEEHIVLKHPQRTDVAVLVDTLKGLDQVEQKVDTARDQRRMERVKDPRFLILLLAEPERSWMRVLDKGILSHIEGSANSRSCSSCIGERRSVRCCLAAEGRRVKRSEGRLQESCWHLSCSIAQRKIVGASWSSYSAHLRTCRPGVSRGPCLLRPVRVL